MSPDMMPGWGYLSAAGAVGAAGAYIAAHYGPKMVSATVGNILFGDVVKAEVSTLPTVSVHQVGRRGPWRSTFRNYSPGAVRFVRATKAAAEEAAWAAFDETLNRCARRYRERRRHA
jgi:hypothetical protein